MRLLTAFNKRLCVGVFSFLFTISLGFMLGSLQTLELTEEKAKLTDKLNQAELELFEAERQIVHCDAELGHKMRAVDKELKPRTIFVITPTYTRPTQLVELTLLSQALAHVPFLHWVVVELSQTSLVRDFLATTNLHTAHLDMEGIEVKKEGNTCNVLRNKALDYLTRQFGNSSGVVLFANTDRTYSGALFEKVRNVERIGIWRTEFAQEQFSCEPLKFTLPIPKYAVNLGSVGFSSSELLKTGLRFPPDVSDTDGVSMFIEQFLRTPEDLRVMSCHDQLVWYTPIHKKSD